MTKKFNLCFYLTIGGFELMVFSSQSNHPAQGGAELVLLWMVTHLHKLVRTKKCKSFSFFTKLVLLSECMSLGPSGVRKLDLRRNLFLIKIYKNT